MKLFRTTLKWGYLLLLLPGVLALSAWQGYQWWHWAIAPLATTPEPSAQTTALQIEVPQNTSTRQIGADLEATGLIRSAWAWNLWASYLSLQDRDGSFKAGTYLLSPQTEMKAIAQTIWTGEVVARGFTIPEGWSLAQMGQYLEKRGLFSAQDFAKATSTIPRERFDWLPTEITSVEGFLYPDTYQLPNQAATPNQVIHLMLQRFEEIALPKLEQYNAANPDNSLSLLNWVTLASLVEKEAVIDSERPIIAGVFLKRLERGIKLESDPTVEYAFGLTQTPDQPLTLAQVQQPSPYNTYVNPGLPPGPIASPRVKSLEAVLAPEVTDFLYFVARYDGTHVFSKTAAEHEAAKAEIQNSVP
ncbi:MAG: endolytic transglycosylase MltG [Spirulina sp. SIO3F2]|nr:endolytic transglycosylase MltG [Spirulina sp. SIO3F2]